MSNTPREDVIKLAREAGFSAKQTDFYFDRQLERFYALAVAKAVAEEREACAKVCDERAMLHYKNVTEDELERCAAAIRARSNT